MNTLTLKQIEKKYGNQYFVLSKQSIGCFNHKSIGECNSIKYHNQKGKKCESLYEVGNVSKVIRENYNDINYYYNKESVGK
tara:strand:+ start:584 stop:826 length:243 start_codon:yes stop_codon:yes gene_type:complete